MSEAALSVLAQIPLFKELRADELSLLAPGVSEVHAVRGELLFRQGDPCTGFHIVVSGQLKLSFMAPSGAEKVVEIISPGQTFGEAVMFMSMPYRVSAQALRESRLLHIAKSVVLEQIRSNPEFACRMIAGLSRRLHSLVSDLESYSMRSGTQRVIGYLLGSEPEAAAKGGPFTVALPTSKHVIASRLNLTPESFSRVLHELGAAGLVSIEGRNVTILDAKRLRTQEA
jgi:CRP/FNR family transcriptional regulator, dissimilatory nitrate respiration regulator